MVRNGESVYITTIFVTKGEFVLSNYFEGWYFKHQKGQETLAVIAGRSDDEAFIQVITPQGSYRVEYPLSEYQKGKTLHISDNIFSPDGISLCINHQLIKLTGHLQYDKLTPISGNIMGPFRFFPMQCKHTVVSMNHKLTGKVCLNGREIDFTGGKGYIEGDSGRSFPKSYTWVQCNNFNQNCSIMASVAHIPFAFWQFWGCICVVYLDNKEYRLATYHGVKILHRDEKQLILTQKDLTLKMLFLEPHSGHPLAAPVNGKMVRSIHEVPCAPAYFEFRQGDRILFQEKSLFASYEHIV